MGLCITHRPTALGSLRQDKVHFRGRHQPGPQQGAFGLPVNIIQPGNMRVIGRLFCRGAEVIGSSAQNARRQAYIIRAGIDGHSLNPL
ncbi:hypothetical protein D9M69_631760 [compost metagenome]